MNGKRCSKCKHTKPLASFARDKGKKDGRAHVCKECFNSRDKGRNHRARNLRDRYGITEAQYAEILAAQAGGCAICGGTDRLHVDHNHTTGKVRGILCFGCNAAIGQMKEDVSILRRAVAYLESKQ